MADMNFDDLEVDYFPAPRNGRLQRMANVAGAVTSIALVLGVAVWGYKLAVRDVTGIPVVRALDAPMRITPDDPGGVIASHQGLSVNSVAAEGEAAAPPDRLVLAPRPVELALEDQAGIAGVGSASVALMNASLRRDEPEVTIAKVDEPVMLAAPAPVAPDPGAAAQVPLAEPETQVAALVLEAVEDEPLAPVIEGGLARSLRPAPRPSDDLMVQAALQSVSASFASAVTAEVDPASLTPGTRLVQLGAFDDAEGAHREWDALQARFGDLMVGRARVVQSAQSGGRTFFRLRAHGFADEADARRFCSALLAENAACIPVSIR